MATELNKAIMLRLPEQGVNANDPAVFDELLAEDFVNHDQTQPDVADREALKRFRAARCRAFPISTPLPRIRSASETGSSSGPFGAARKVASS